MENGKREKEAGKSISAKLSQQTSFVFQDADLWLRVLGVLNNAADQLFYPLEHLGWLLQQRVITWNGSADSLDGALSASAPFADAANYCWAASLYIHISKAFRFLLLLRREERWLAAAGTLTV